MENDNELTKEDILDVTGSVFSTMFDYIDNSTKEQEELKNIISNIKLLCEEEINKCQNHHEIRAYQNVLDKIKSMEEANNG